MRYLLHLVLLTAMLAICPPAMAGQWFPRKDRAGGDALYQSAFAAYDKGDYVGAQTLLDQAEKLKPDQADGWNLRGAVFLKQRAWDKADYAFARAMKLDPALWAAQFNYAEVGFQSKNYPLARARFDRLLSQTNRFKQQNQWELAQYKSFLSSLLMNDEPGAQKRLAKLPAVGGATPAAIYAQAAIAFRRKDLAAAQKSLTTAQASFSTTLNGLFSDSLVNAGWQSPAPPPMTMSPAYASTGAYPYPSSPSQPAFVIDPKIEAAAAEPLPAPDAAGAGGTATRTLAPPQMMLNASPSDAVMQQMTAAPVPKLPIAAPTPSSDSALERGILLD